MWPIWVQLWVTERGCQVVYREWLSLRVVQVRERLLCVRSCERRLLFPDLLPRGPDQLHKRPSPVLEEYRSKFRFLIHLSIQFFLLPRWTVYIHCGDSVKYIVLDFCVIFLISFYAAIQHQSIYLSGNILLPKILWHNLKLPNLI